jgi:hypothetical protein
MISGVPAAAPALTPSSNSAATEEEAADAAADAPSGDVIGKLEMCFHFRCF